MENHSEQRVSIDHRMTYITPTSTTSVTSTRQSPKAGCLRQRVLPHSPGPSTKCNDGGYRTLNLAPPSPTHDECVL